MDDQRGAVVVFYEPTKALLDRLSADRIPLLSLVFACEHNDEGLRKRAVDLGANYRHFNAADPVDVRAHIKDATVLCLGGRGGGAMRRETLVRCCLEIGVHYLDEEDVDPEGVFEAAASLDGLPTCIVTSGMGGAAAVLDCLAAYARNKLCVHDLQKVPAPKLVLVQSESLLTNRQRKLLSGQQEEMRDGYVPFVMKNGLKHMVAPGERTMEAPLQSNFRWDPVDLNPYSGATFLTMLDSGILTIEAYVSRRKSSLKSSSRDVGALLAIIQGTKWGARLTVPLSVEELSAHMMIECVRKLASGDYPSHLMGFVTPSQLLGPDFVREGLPRCSFIEVVDVEKARSDDSFPWALVIFLLLSFIFVYYFVRR